MKSMFRLLVVVLLLGGWTLAALCLHVVRTPEQIPITIVTKEKLGFDETWVDTTQWTLQDATKHPVVVERLIRTDNADVLSHVVDPEKGDVEQQLSDALGRAPEAPPNESGSTVDKLARRAGFRWPWDK